MSRNYFQAKNYRWERSGGYIRCFDRDYRGEKCLFLIADEGMDDNMINAYMAGITEGQKQGRIKLQGEFRKALADPDYDA